MLCPYFFKMQSEPGKLLGEHLTSLISVHISFAVVICEVPDIRKQGHSDT